MSVLKGILIALSMLVPGVSGGTMMILLNVYTPTLEFLDGLTRGKLLHKRLMLNLLIGGLIGLFGMGWILLWLLSLSKVSMYYLFMGIALMGALYLIKQLVFEHIKSHHLLYIILGAMSAFALKFMPQVNIVTLESSHFSKLFWILCGGMVIAIALILPGISTSYLLLVMGLYEPTLNAIQSFNIKFLLPMIIGIGVGILLTTRLLNWLLQHHPTPTYLVIIGFVLGSIPQIYPGLPHDSFQLIRSLIMFVLGIGVMMGLHQLGLKKSDELDD